jgi:glycosyltransferase involved in cell wall biosynthesis
VTRLVDDAELRERLGAAGRERAVARFDLAVVCEKTRELYRELLGRSAGRLLGRTP